MKEKLGLSYGAHEWVQNTNSERCATGERLCHVEFCVRVVIIILVQELHVSIIACKQTRDQYH